MPEIRVVRDVKESGEFKGLGYRNAEGKAAIVATFEEYCNHILKRPYRTVKRYLDSEELLGDDYDHAVKIGFTANDFAALKKMPEDSRTQILEHEAFKTGDVNQIRAAVKAFSEEQKLMILEHDEEKKKLQKEIQAKERVLGLKEKKLNESTEKVNELEEKIANEGKFYTPEEIKNARLEQIIAGIQTQTRQILTTYTVTLRKYLNDLNSDEGCEVIHQTIAGDLVVGPVRAMQDLLNEFNIETTTVLPFDANATAAADILPSLKAYFAQP